MLTVTVGAAPVSRVLEFPKSDTCSNNMHAIFQSLSVGRRGPAAVSEISVLCVYGMWWTPAYTKRRLSTNHTDAGVVGPYLLCYIHGWLSVVGFDLYNKYDYPRIR